MTHDLRSDLWWTIPFRIWSTFNGPYKSPWSLVVRLYSEIDHTYLSIEAQCVSHHYPRWTAKRWPKGSSHKIGSELVQNWFRIGSDVVLCLQGIGNTFLHLCQIWSNMNKVFLENARMPIGRFNHWWLIGGPSVTGTPVVQDRHMSAWRGTHPWSVMQIFT